jgi:hypothetical protein
MLAGLLESMQGNHVGDGAIRSTWQLGGSQCNVSASLPVLHTSFKHNRQPLVQNIDALT